MNPIRHIRRPGAILAGLAAIILVALGATPAFATVPVPDPGAGYVGPVSNTPQLQVPTVVASGARLLWSRRPQRHQLAHKFDPVTLYQGRFGPMG